MSVDYDASYGLGYKISEPDWFDGNSYDEEYELDFQEWIESEVDENVIIQVIGSYYSGKIRLIITILDPLKYGLDLTKSKKELDDNLSRLNIIPDSEFSLVGGVLIS